MADRGVPKWLQFIEGPLFLLSVGTLSAVIGVIYYWPIGILCGVCVLLEFHKVGFVRGTPRRAQVFIYSCLLLLVTAGLYGVGRVVDRGAQRYIQRLAEAVANAVTGQERKAEESGAAFSPELELALVEDLGNPGRGTGFWMRFPSPDGCLLSPVHFALYIRLTSLRSVPTMLTAYSIGSGNTELVRLPQSLLLWTPLKGTFKGLVPGNTLNFGQGQGRIFHVSSALADEDMRHAISVRVDTLEEALGGKSLSPNQTVRGWAFFEYPRNSYVKIEDLNMTLNDEVGHTFSYPLSAKVGNANEDISPRQITFQTVSDVSTCVQRRYSR